VINNPFKIGDFIVLTEKRTEKSSEQIAVPTNLEAGKPSEYKWKYKTREITVFKKLNLLDKTDGEYYQVISDLFDFIDLIELLKAFNGNKLDTNKQYKISDRFTALTASKNGKMSLRILFAGYTYSLYLDKFECSSLAAKFGKILQKCEAWQELEA
jgi:hypothetical protein